MALHEVIAVTWPCAGTAILRLTREAFTFAPGQHVLAGLPGGDVREYSIFSAPDDPWLELLLRVIPEGRVSPRLAAGRAGDRVTVEGPIGSFLLPAQPAGVPLLFVATGTGIAPFHCMVRACPDLDYHVLHGVRHAIEQVARDAFKPARYTGCLSRESGGQFDGRVTDCLRRRPPAPATECYLCGSCDMIYEAFAILAAHGVPRDHIHVETYY